MASNICSIDSGITLTRQDIATYQHSVIFDMIRKVNLSGYSYGDTFHVRLENLPTGAVTEQNVAVVENGCGVKEWNICPCDSMTRLPMKVNNRFACANRYNKCLSTFRNEYDETEVNAVILDEDLYRQRRLAENIKSSLNKAVIKQIISGGTEYTPTLTATSTLEEIMDGLDFVSNQFDEQGYSLENRYVMLDPALFNKLVKGANNNIGCCADIVVVAGKVQTLQYLGMTIARAVKLQELYGVSMLALHGDYVILGTKCGSNENGIIDVKIVTDNNSFKDANTEVEYDLYKAEFIYGMTILQEAVIYSGTPIVLKGEKVVPEENTTTV